MRQSHNEAGYRQLAADIVRRMPADPRLIRSISRRRVSDGPMTPPAPLALLVSMEAKKAAGMVDAKTLPRFSIIPHENDDKCHTPDGKNSKV